jgi:hypothetical protein
MRVGVVFTPNLDAQREIQASCGPMRRKWTSAWIAAIVAGIAMAATTRVAAQTKPPKLVALDWEAGPGTEGCITAEQLKEAVEGQLERGVFTFVGEATPETTHIHVRLERSPDGQTFHAVASVEIATDPSDAAAAGPTNTSTRELDSTGADCRTLDQPLALVVSVMAGSEVIGASQEPQSEPESSRPSSAQSDAERDEPSGPILTVHEHRTPSEPWNLAVDFAPALGLGLLPSVGAGIQVGGMALPPSFPALRAQAVGWLPENEELAPQASVSFTMAYAGAALCPALYSSAAALLHVCLGGDLGVLRAESKGLVRSRTTTDFFPLVDGSVRGALRIAAQWQAVASVAVLFPTSPDRFVYELPGGGQRQIHDIDSVSMTAALGVAFTLR